MTSRHFRPCRPIAAAVLALLPLTARPASATTVSFPDFSDTTGLALNGSAAAVSTGDGAVLRIVPASAAKAGSFFSSTTVRTADFSSAFSFRITNPGGISDAQGEQGADGFVFVVQPVSSNVGGAGSGLGYAGITPSVGVEFDIFFNGASDTSTNHLGVDLNGNVNSVAAIHVSPRWDDGNRWYAWVDYDGTTLEVRVNQTGVRPMDPLLSRDVDIATVIGQDQAFVGFTAGTGSAWADHDIIEWRYFDAFNPGGTTTTTTSTPPTTATTTTVPGGDRCATEPDGPTFVSLNCRLAALLAATQAADGLDDLRDALLAPLGKAKERKETAERLCAEGQARQPKARLKQVVRQLKQYAHRLRGRAARKRAGEEVREPLAQAADAIRADTRTLRSALRCPENARGA